MKIVHGHLTPSLFLYTVFFTMTDNSCPASKAKNLEHRKMALEHAENAVNFLYRITASTTSFFSFIFIFQDLSVPTSVRFIDYAKFDSPPKSLKR